MIETQVEPTPPNKKNNNKSKNEKKQQVRTQDRVPKYDSRPFQVAAIAHSRQESALFLATLLRGVYWLSKEEEIAKDLPQLCEMPGGGGGDDGPAGVLFAF